MMPFERLKFPSQRLAGILIVGISLLLVLATPPLYLDIPINIILGYVAYPFVFSLFTDKMSLFLTDKESSTLKEPEKVLISLTTYQLPGMGSKERLQTIVTIGIFWGIGEVALWGFSILFWILVLIAVALKQIL
jgi:hypothetical protein